MKIWIFGIIFASIVIAVSQNASAMPNFARKEGVSCNVCHTTIPKLSAVGYVYRANGFRMPGNLGKPQSEKFDLGNYFAGRLQARYDYKESNVANTTNQLSFHEATLYPATGSWGKYFSSLFELSLAPEEPVEIENAYVRINAGNDKRSFSTRVGIFHPFEGFGASDRPVSLSRPFFQTNPANFGQSTFFKPWGFDQAGIEIGLDHGSTSVRFTVFNGLVLKTEDGKIMTFPAQGGPLSKDAGNNRPDLQVFLNQRLHNDGGGLSFYYYNGTLGLPVAGDLANTFKNEYSRVGVYAGYPFLKSKLHLLTGFQQGHDRLLSGKTFTSRGYFGEADVPLGQYATTGVRYDWFDPAVGKSRNELNGITAFVNMPLQNGFQLIGEYQRKNQLRGSNPEKKDNTFQLRVIFIL